MILASASPAPDANHPRLETKMALVEVKIPQLSESVSEATLLQWKKKAGEAVAADEILIEVETDKVVLEVPAPASGVLAEIIENDGATVTADQLIARIDTAAAAASANAHTDAPAPDTLATTAPAQTLSAPGGKAGFAMPAAAKILADKHIDPASIAGTGKDGRITKADALAAIATPPDAARPAQPAMPPAPPIAPAMAGNRAEERVPMSRLRTRIAERLLQSQATNAILTTFNEVNMQPVMDMRKRFQEKFEKQHGVRLGFMSFFVKAVVHALKQYPILNASIDGSDIIYHGYFDIGVAVGSPRGLVVPILRDADQMSFADIEKKIAEFGAKARDGKLGIEEMSGGTFSISNGGVFGSMMSTPIIIPPQSAILGVHATKERPVVENGQIVIRPMNYLAMSYDHRIIDGREAVLGLVAMKEALEDPARLLFDL